MTKAADAPPRVSEADANALAKLVVDAYNANDIATLYSRFDDLAKIQFDQDELAKKTTKLHSLFGNVQQFVFLRSENLGTQNGRTSLSLLFKVRFTNPLSSQGEMKLTVIPTPNGQLRLLLFYLST